MLRELFQQINLSGRVISIANGGTGAATALDARTNLNVYSTADTDALIAQAIKERAIWGYQDFIAGDITSTSVTLTANSNGTSAIFDVAKIISSSASLFRQDGISYAFTGTTSLFSSKITVASQVGATITLSGIPNASWGTLRIWYQIKSTVYPQDYQNPPLTVQTTVVTALGALFEEQENKVTDFTVVNDILYPSALAVSTALALKQTIAKDTSGGYPGLTLFKINFKNAANTFTSFLTNSNTASRTYTFQDRAGTILDDTNLAAINISLSAKQDANTNLTSLASLTLPVDGLLYSSGSGTITTSTVTAAARTVLDDTTVAAMVNTLGGATSTGSGGLARATSPVFVTPALGTPASGVLTNCSGYPTAALPAGTCIQVVSVPKLDTASTTSSTYTAIAGMSASITTLNSSSKILVRVSLNVGGTNLQRAHFQLFRGATQIALADAAGLRSRTSAAFYSANAGCMASVNFEFLDTPAAIGAVTYSVQWASPDNVSAMYINRTVTDTSVATIPRTISTIVLQEFKG